MDDSYESNIVSGLVKYSEETSVHGIKYVFRTKRPKFERLYWIVLLAAQMITFGYFVYASVSQFLEFPMKLKESSQLTHVFEIPFPAVTVCPSYKIKHFSDSQDVVNAELMKYLNKSEKEFWQSDYGSKLILATQICRNRYNDTLTKALQFFENGQSINKPDHVEINRHSVQKLLEMSTTLFDIFEEAQLANWNGNALGVMSYKNVNKIFSRIVTNEGVCFTFNTVSDLLRDEPPIYNSWMYNLAFIIRDGWHPETGYVQNEAYPFKAIVRGDDEPTGLSFDLIANLSNLFDLCYPKNVAYKLILHSPSAYPNTYEKFISLELGKEYTIAISPKTISTRHDIRSIRPEVRQCYFNDERQLKYYTFYNENNCKLECYANYSLKSLGCFPFSVPKDEDTPICQLKSNSYGWHLPNYYNLNYEYNKIYNKKFNLSTALNTTCNCLPECNSLRYDYEIVGNNVNMLEVIQTESFSNFSMTSVEIIFENPTFIGKERIREFTFASLVSKFGSLLGLFMGGSLISVFELIFFLTVFICCRHKL